MAFDFPSAMVGEIHHEAVVSTSFGLGEGHFAKLQAGESDFQHGQLHYQSQSIALAHQLGINQVLPLNSNPGLDDVRFAGTDGQFTMNTDGDVYRLNELGEAFGELVGTASPFFFQNPELFSTIPAEIQDRYKLQSHEDSRRNSGNRGEVWFKSPRVKNGYLYLLPDGSLHEWTEDSSDLTPSADNLAGQVGPFFHQHPEVLVLWNTTGHGLIQLDIKPVGPSVEGVDAGFAGGDLRFFENQWRGSTNKNEYTVEGTFLQASAGETFSLGHLGFGIAVQDSESGSGYLMYSSENVHERFAAAPPLSGSSDHVIAVRLEQGAWQYSTNQQWVPFAPVTDDRLLAAVEFKNGEVQSYQGFDDLYAGMARGYQDGDLRFEGNSWKYAENDGEYQLHGTYFRTSDQPPISIGEIRGGITTSDDARGRGYLMHSPVDLTRRFRATNFQQHHSSHLIAVRRRDGVWQYNDNKAWVPFDPIEGDRLLAEVNFSDDQVQSFQNMSGRRNGIELGFVGGDLRFHANWFRERNNAGEFFVEGTHYHVGNAIGPTENGIAVSDNATGVAFLMHSQLPLNDRFASSKWRNGHAEHLVAVRYRDGSWFYNDNQSWRSFSPAASDHLLARLDLDATSITALFGDHAPVEGISAGFASGDLRFEANRWGDLGDLGEYQVSGTYYVPNPIAMTSLGQINGGLAVADGATGSGYVLHSDRPLDQRDGIAVHSLNSSQLLIVRQIGGQWEYNGNSDWEPFTSKDGDRLIAAVDFKDDSISGLVGHSTLIGGIEAGYVDGDLNYTANWFNGSDNAGEYTVTGSYFRSQPVRAIPLGIVNSGIAVSDDAFGRGYVMHSATPIRVRFAESSFRDDVSHQLLVIRRFAGQWQFNDNRNWTTFVPEPGDVILAEIDFDAGEISSFQNLLGTIGGIDRGYVDGDLRFLANQFNQQNNDGEYTVDGTFFQRGSSLGAINYGIAVDDQAIGKGYVLLSERAINGRLPSHSLAANNSSRMAAVQYRDGSWFMNDNDQWIAFEPAASDRLIAAIDFDTNAITSFHSDQNVLGIEGDSHYINIVDVVPGFEDRFEIELQEDSTSEPVLLMTSFLGDANNVAEYSDNGELLSRAKKTLTREIVQTRTDDAASDVFYVNGQPIAEIERSTDGSVTTYQIGSQNEIITKQFVAGQDGQESLFIPSLNQYQTGLLTIEGGLVQSQVIQDDGEVRTTTVRAGVTYTEIDSAEEDSLEVIFDEGFEVVDGQRLPVRTIQETTESNDAAVDYVQTTFRQIGGRPRTQTHEVVYFADGGTQRRFFDPDDSSKEITHYLDADQRIFQTDVRDLNTSVNETTETLFVYDDAGNVTQTTIRLVTFEPERLVSISRSNARLPTGSDVDTMYVRGLDGSAFETVKVDDQLAVERRIAPDGRYQDVLHPPINQILPGTLTQSVVTRKLNFERQTDSQAVVLVDTYIGGGRYEIHRSGNTYRTQTLGADGKPTYQETYIDDVLFGVVDYRPDGTVFETKFGENIEIRLNAGNTQKVSGTRVIVTSENSVSQGFYTSPGNLLVEFTNVSVGSDGKQNVLRRTFKEPGQFDEYTEIKTIGGEFQYEFTKLDYSEYFVLQQNDGTIVRSRFIPNGPIDGGAQPVFLEVREPNGRGQRTTYFPSTGLGFFSTVPFYDKFEEFFENGQLVRSVLHKKVRVAVEDGLVDTISVENPSAAQLGLASDGCKVNSINGLGNCVKGFTDRNDPSDNLNSAIDWINANTDGLPSLNGLLSSDNQLLKDLAEQIRKGISPIMEGLAGFLDDFKSTVFDPLSANVSEILGGIDDLKDKILDDIGDEAQLFIDGIENPFGGLANLDPDSINFDLPSLPSINQVDFGQFVDVAGIEGNFVQQFQSTFSTQTLLDLGKAFNDLIISDSNPLVRFVDYLEELPCKLVSCRELPPLRPTPPVGERDKGDFFITLDFTDANGVDQSGQFLADPNNATQNVLALQAVRDAARTISLLINTHLEEINEPDNRLRDWLISDPTTNNSPPSIRINDTSLGAGEFRVYVGQYNSPTGVASASMGSLDVNSNTPAWTISDHYNRGGGPTELDRQNEITASVGSMRFNANHNWHYDSRTNPNTTTAQVMDLYHVALHELYHILGISDNPRTTQWDNVVASHIAGGVSTGNAINVALQNGGTIGVPFENRCTVVSQTCPTGVTFDPDYGHIDALPNNAAGYGFSWADPTVLAPATQATNGPSNTRLHFNDVDAAMLRAAGWDVPSRANFLAGLSNTDYAFLQQIGWQLPNRPSPFTLASPTSSVRESQYDVNADGLITARDALMIINKLHALEPSGEPVSSLSANDDHGDVNGDQRVSALDALMIINYLNSQDEVSHEADHIQSQVASQQGILEERIFEKNQRKSWQLPMLHGSIIQSPFNQERGDERLDIASQIDAALADTQLF